MDFLRRRGLEFVYGQDNYRGVKASAAITRGTTLFTEEAFAAVPVSMDVCHNCYRECKVTICSRCRNASYCSTGCQRADFAIHKLTCTKNIGDDAQMLLKGDCNL